MEAILFSKDTTSREQVSTDLAVECVVVVVLREERDRAPSTTGTGSPWISDQLLTLSRTFFYTRIAETRHAQHEIDFLLYILFRKVIRISTHTAVERRVRSLIIRKGINFDMFSVLFFLSFAASQHKSKYFTRKVDLN